jgi:glycogen operon protein
VEKLRSRQVKNFLTVTMLSLGVPMIVMGDEVRRTQLGNNNGYCLDNDISWFDWTLISRRADVHRFLKLLIARRRLRDLYPEHQLESLNQLLAQAHKAWHGVKLGQPDWSPWSHSLAFAVEHPKEKVLFHVILNAYWQPLEFELPLPGSRGAGPWRRWIDTALDSPKDIVEWKEAQSISSQPYRAESRSVAVLFANVGELVP